MSVTVKSKWQILFKKNTVMGMKSVGNYGLAKQKHKQGQWITEQLCKNRLAKTDISRQICLSLVKYEQQDNSSTGAGWEQHSFSAYKLHVDRHLPNDEVIETSANRSDGP